MLYGAAQDRPTTRPVTASKQQARIDSVPPSTPNTNFRSTFVGLVIGDDDDDDDDADTDGVVMIVSAVTVTSVVKMILREYSSSAAMQIQRQRGVFVLPVVFVPRGIIIVN